MNQTLESSVYVHEPSKAQVKTENTVDIASLSNNEPVESSVQRETEEIAVKNVNQTRELLSRVREPGKAQIKAEYVVDAASLRKEEPEELPVKSTTEKESASPPPKKKRRGQNKNRPRTTRDKIEDCLCPSLVNDEGECTFGDKCKFIHDVSKFMLMKPEDLGEECYMYKTHGKCNYGFACRYGSCHIRKNDDGTYVNLIDKEKMERNPVSKIQNSFPRELRIALRKKQYSFPKSDEALKLLSRNTNKKAGVESSKTATDSAQGGLLHSDNLHQYGDRVNVSHLENNSAVTTAGIVTNEDLVALKNGEKKTLKFDGKLFLAPLTTVGNLPFRVTCKSLGADITCGEMAMSTCLLQGNVSEWALLKRHPCEDFFGVQICGSFPDTMTKCVEMIERECDVDFVDINMGCPIDLVFFKGAGSALMQRTNKLFDIVKSMKRVMNIPLTCKMRTGVDSKRNTAHDILPKLRDYDVSLCTVHGRSRQARYTKLADWKYLEDCAKAAAPMPLFGNGDILSYEDYNRAVKSDNISGVMIARGALIKPWIFTEIKEQRHWDIASCERFDILKKFVNMGLMHWGSDSRGVETTRRFLLEWLSFLHRYIPVGILEQAPQKINEKPPIYVGRNDLETLMAERNCKAWITLSEMLLGKVPNGFQFLPKHKANSYN